MPSHYRDSDEPAEPFTDDELDAIRRTLRHYDRASTVARLLATLDDRRSRSERRP